MLTYYLDEYKKPIIVGILVLVLLVAAYFFVLKKDNTSNSFTPSQSTPTKQVQTNQINLGLLISTACGKNAQAIDTKPQGSNTVITCSNKKKVVITADDLKNAKPTGPTNQTPDAASEASARKNQPK